MFSSRGNKLVFSHEQQESKMVSGTANIVAWRTSENEAAAAAAVTRKGREGDAPQDLSCA